MTTKDFIPGNFYFFVTYLNADNKVPAIKSLIYIGENIYNKTGNKGKFYFQKYESYINILSSKRKNRQNTRKVISINDKALTKLYDIDGLITSLKYINNQL